MAGVLSAGTNCVTTLSGAKTTQTFEEMIYALEPQIDSEGKVTGGSVMMPLNDFVDLKTSLEQACVYVRCNKKKLATVLKNINSLLDQTKKGLSAP